MNIMMKYIIKHFSSVAWRREEIRSNPFFEPLYIKYTHGYNKPITIGVSYLQLLDINLIIEYICSMLPKGGYTLFIKLKHYGNNYKMCGDQIGFNYNHYDDFIGLLNLGKNRVNKILEEYKILVSYTPGLDDNVIKSNNLDIVKISKKYKDKEHLGYENSSVAISVEVTAYARIHITQLKLYIINLGGILFIYR